MKIEITKYYKKLFTEDNKTKLIGLLSILVFLWLILYVIPSFFILLFHTFLGNIILLLSVLLISATYNAQYGIIATICIIILYRISYPSSSKTIETKENYENQWTQDSTNTFLKIQNTINRNINFDTSMIQQQATQEELDYFNENGKWPWSQTTKDLYTDALNKNVYIRAYPNDSIIQAQTIYNENAIQQILKMQTKEGKFLQRGVEINQGTHEDDTSGIGVFGYTSGLKTNKTNTNSKIIKCDSNTNELKQIQFMGYGGILTEQVNKETPVNYHDLENIIPGFKFINEPCNPCTNMGNSTNYCPFILDLSENEIGANGTTKNNGESGISALWKYLWFKSTFL